ncbi:MAG: SLBB domain-containing protein [Curvibacter sp.]|nr:SLBB domain-containing protein [Curvibacter sp.]
MAPAAPSAAAAVPAQSEPGPGRSAAVSSASPVDRSVPLGVGDVIQVTVFGQPDMSAEVTVSDGGDVTLPLIGPLHLKGMGQGAVEKLIAQRLREGQFLRNPDVTVVLKQVRSQMVSVLGEVQRPGRYPLQGRVTVLDMLATAGGLTTRADTVAYVLRAADGAKAQPQRIPVRLDKVAEADRTPLEVTLSGDDVVFVGPQKFFYIYGEVRRPGSYPMEPDLDVMRALSLGGGVTDRGSMSRIRLHRRTDRAEGEDLSPGLTDPVREGDVIFVKERLF